jgi:hypothetical protein
MPQPIDPFTELGRMQAVERIQQIADRASLAAQQRAQTALQEKLLNIEQQVHEPEQKGTEVDQELRRRNPFMGRRRRRQGEDGAEAEKKRPGDGEDHQLDVTV